MRRRPDRTDGKSAARDVLPILESGSARFIRYNDGVVGKSPRFAGLRSDDADRLFPRHIVKPRIDAGDAKVDVARNHSRGNRDPRVEKHNLRAETFRDEVTFFLSDVNRARARRLEDPDLDRFSIRLAGSK